MELFLIRHGQSITNIDPTLYRTLADHAVPLSPLGVKQAGDAGRLLAAYLTSETYTARADTELSDSRLRVWSSPYRRTRETADGIRSGLAAAGVAADYREHINLCEQQFGLFDGIPDEELPVRFPEEHAHYRKCQEHEGKFWARMPLGESRFDVAIRVHQAFGTFHRDAVRHDIRRLAIVCHGVTLRAIVMQWLHLPYEWFDAESSPANCAIRHIRDGEDLGYLQADLSHVLPANGHRDMAS